MINKVEFEKRTKFYKIAQLLGLKTNSPRTILLFVKQQFKEEEDSSVPEFLVSGYNILSENMKLSPARKWKITDSVSMYLTCVIFLTSEQYEKIDHSISDYVDRLEDIFEEIEEFRLTVNISDDIKYVFAISSYVFGDTIDIIFKSKTSPKHFIYDGKDYILNIRLIDDTLTGKEFAAYWGETLKQNSFDLGDTTYIDVVHTLLLTEEQANKLTSYKINGVEVLRDVYLTPHDNVYILDMHSGIENLTDTVVITYDGRDYTYKLGNNILIP